MMFKEQQGDKHWRNGSPGAGSAAVGGRLGHFLESLVLLHSSLAPCVRVLSFDAFLGVQQSVEFYIPRPHILRPQKMFSLCNSAAAPRGPRTLRGSWILSGFTSCDSGVILEKRD